MEPKTTSRYVLVRWLFLRLLALVYFSAFASLTGQITGLVGSEGILPAQDFLNQAFTQLGYSAYWRVPTLFWFNDSDFSLITACVLGMVASLFVFKAYWLRTNLFICYALYLSLTVIGQDFMAFQWDMLLMECGILAILLPGNSPIVIWLYRFLLFRFMLMGGVVKISSGDLSWRSLTALYYHFETQPLPSPLAWFAHQLPDQLLILGTLSVLFIELIVPFFVFLNRPFQLVAAANFLLLQVSIILTGNYNFFNLLVIFLCLFLFEDQDIKRILTPRAVETVLPKFTPPSHEDQAEAALMALFTFFVLVGSVWWVTVHEPPPQPIASFVRTAQTFGLVNHYGPFAVMTKERQEIIIEGSRDGKTWLAYPFKFKPDTLNKELSWIIPYQPRLDWQMWFAALGSEEQSPWFQQFLNRILQGSWPVISLFDYDPFPSEPPRYVRALLYRYHYTTPQLRYKTGNIWKREYAGVYVPAYSLDGSIPQP